MATKRQVKTIRYQHLCNIWSNFMRTHIGLKICHFLQSVVSITKGQKNKIMRKSGIQSSVPFRDRTLEQFLFSLVSKIIEKNGLSLGLFFMAKVLFWWMYCAIAAAPKDTAFFIFSTHPVTYSAELLRQMRISKQLRKSISWW